MSVCELTAVEDETNPGAGSSSTSEVGSHSENRSSGAARKEI